MKKLVITMLLLLFSTTVYAEDICKAMAELAFFSVQQRATGVSVTQFIQQANNQEMPEKTRTLIKTIVLEAYKIDMGYDWRKAAAEYSNRVAIVCYEN